MYHALKPHEKLLYLSLWQEADIGKAAKSCGVKREEAAKTAEKLAGIGIVKRTKKGFVADLGYLAGIIERDNHFYPHRRMGEKAASEFVKFLGSREAAKLAQSKFDSAISLAAGSKEVLSGFFWAVFSDYVIIAGAYRESFAKDTAGNRRAFRNALIRENKAKRIFPDEALKSALPFSIPAEAAEFLGWSVNQSPKKFVVREMLRDHAR
jgi:hypothetical protein